MSEKDLDDYWAKCEKEVQIYQRQKQLQRFIKQEKRDTIALYVAMAAIWLAGSCSLMIPAMLVIFSSSKELKPDMSDKQYFHWFWDGTTATGVLFFLAWSFAVFFVGCCICGQLSIQAEQTVQTLKEIRGELKRLEKQ